jgi:hypothetical protein
MNVMKEPVWIDCKSVFDVPNADLLASQADGDRFVILRFPSLLSHELKALIADLSDALPSFSVFQSSPTLIPAQVTVLGVIADSAILNNVDRISAAVNDYLSTSQALADQLRSGTLAQCWQIDEHGAHCRFENKDSGQIVEVLMEDTGDPIDPYFFSEFVCSTSRHTELSHLINHKFHDGARILDTFHGWRGAQKRL